MTTVYVGDLCDVREKKRRKRRRKGRMKRRKRERKGLLSYW